MGILRSKIRYWESSTTINIWIIIIIIINAYYNYTIQLVEKCDKEDNLGVTEAATTCTSCWKKKTLKLFVKVTYSPSNRQAGAEW